MSIAVQLTHLETSDGLIRKTDMIECWSNRGKGETRDKDVQARVLSELIIRSTLASDTKRFHLYRGKINVVYPSSVPAADT